MSSSPREWHRNGDEDVATPLHVNQDRPTTPPIRRNP